jgi:DNA-binding HxlR family transcriptional regulator/uncharacterized protein YoxC
LLVRTMGSFEEETYSTVFTSLRHPIRRKILRTLSAGPQSFSDLQRTLGIESSHLTYHLEGLTSLLAKTEHGEYALSSLGRIAVSTMKQVEEPSSTPLRTQFWPRFWRRERARVLALGIICIILGVGLVGVFAYHMSAMNDKNSTISLLNSQVTALQNQILSADSTINSLNSQTAELENQLVSNNSIVAADNSTIANLQRQITTLQNQANSLQNQINDLSSKYSAGATSLLPPIPNPLTYKQQAQVYFSVEPVAVDPLINVNASINGLEIPSSPSALGQTFTVEIHFRNATEANVQAGVCGVEVYFDFGNILNYCKPIGFTTMLGQSGGVLTGSLLYVFNGFFDVKGNQIIDTASYDQATQYAVCAASTAKVGWNNDDGLVAKITFQVTGQPSQVLNQSDFYSQLRITYSELNDNNAQEIPVSVVQGTLQIDADPPAGVHITIPGDINGDFKVNLQDLVLLADSYGSKPGDAKWNRNADINGDGVVDSADLAMLAKYYG